MKNKFVVLGEATEIFLKRKRGEPLKTIIDTKDLNIANSVNSSWYASFSKGTKSFYAICSQYRNGKRTTIGLHHLLISPIDGNVTDHINHDTLNNRRCNLREVTDSENRQNKNMLSNNTSGYRGVHWCKTSKKWKAVVCVNRKFVFQKYYNSVKEAATAVIEARKIYMPYSTN